MLAEDRERGNGAKVVTELRGGAAPASAASEDDDLPRVARALSWIFLVGFFLVSNGARAVYAIHDEPPSARFELLWMVSAISFLWYWLREQCRPYRASFPLDMPYFAAALWFVVVPYYLWHYQRWRGLLKVAALIVAYALSYLASLIAYYALVRSP
jgi:hypothetical protein